MTNELAEAAFLLEIGWSWAEYLAAPDSLVKRMMLLMNARAEASKKDG